MKYWIARWLIDRAADDDRSLPGWVEKLLERDESLRDFQRATRMTVERLRGDAADWITAFDLDSVPPQNRARPARSDSRSHLVSAALVLAAGVLAALTFWLMNPSQPPSNPIVRAHDPQPIPKDQQPPETVLADDMERLIDLVATAPRPQMAKLAIEPAEAAGRLVGRSLAMLDRGLQQEREHLKSDALTTVDYVTSHIQSGLGGFGFREERKEESVHP